MPSTTYAPPAPTLNGDQYTVSYLMNNPVIVWRLLRTIAQQRLIGGRVLKGRIDLTGTGSAIYETSEPIMVDQDPEIVDQLGEYPLVTSAGAATNIATSLKRGFASLVSDEDVKRNRIDVVNRKLLKMANRLVFFADSLALSAVGSAVTQTQAAAAAWTTTTADPFLDIQLAIAQIDALNQGYTADTVVATPEYWGRLVANLVKGFATPLGTPDVISTGNFLEIAGLSLLKSTNLPAGVKIMVLDSNQLGSIGFENLDGGYIGDPADPLGIESKQWHRDEKDAWQIQTRKTGVPIIQEPGAAVKLTGV